MTTLRKRIRRFARGFQARYMPSQFAEWVNGERCSISIVNSADGVWGVSVGGDGKRFESRTLGRACLAAFLHVDRNPEFQWTGDYLRNIEQ